MVNDSQLFREGGLRRFSAECTPRERLDHLGSGFVGHRSAHEQFLPLPVSLFWKERPLDFDPVDPVARNGSALLNCGRVFLPSVEEVAEAQLKTKLTRLWTDDLLDDLRCLHRARDVNILERLLLAVLKNAELKHLRLCWHSRFRSHPRPEDVFLSGLRLRRKTGRERTHRRLVENHAGLGIRVFEIVLQERQVEIRGVPERGRVFGIVLETEFRVVGGALGNGQRPLVLLVVLVPFPLLLLAHVLGAVLPDDLPLSILRNRQQLLDRVASRFFILLQRRRREGLVAAERIEIGSALIIGNERFRHCHTRQHAKGVDVFQLGEPASHDFSTPVRQEFASLEQIFREKADRFGESGLIVFLLRGRHVTFVDDIEHILPELGRGGIAESRGQSIEPDFPLLLLLSVTAETGGFQKLPDRLADFENRSLGKEIPI